MATEQSALSYRIVDDNHTHITRAFFLTGLYVDSTHQSAFASHLDIHTLGYAKVAPPRKPLRNMLSSNEEGANADLIAANLHTQ